MAFSNWPLQGSWATYAASGTFEDLVGQLHATKYFFKIIFVPLAVYPMISGQT